MSTPTRVTLEAGRPGRRGARGGYPATEGSLFHVFLLFFDTIVCVEVVGPARRLLRVRDGRKKGVVQIISGCSSFICCREGYITSVVEGK